MKLFNDLRLNWAHNSSTKETICQLVDKDNKVVTSGIAKAFHKDNFCKATGRKLSLTRALKKSNFNKLERTAVWQIVEENGVNMSF